MSNDTSIIDDHSTRLHHHGATLASSETQLDAYLRSISLKMLALIGQRPPNAGTRSPRQIIVYLTNQYRGPEPEKFDHMCRGLYLMAERHFRQALGEFEAVLEGRVDGEFEIVRELALEAQSYCLQQLDYDDDALEQFTRLLYRKFEETRQSGQADHVSKLLGLAR